MFKQLLFAIVLFAIAMVANAQESSDLTSASNEQTVVAEMTDAVPALEWQKAAGWTDYDWSQFELPTKARCVRTGMCPVVFVGDLPNVI